LIPDIGIGSDHAPTNSFSSIDIVESHTLCNPDGVGIFLDHPVGGINLSVGVSGTSIDSLYTNPVEVFLPSVPTPSSPSVPSVPSFTVLIVT